MKVYLSSFPKSGNTWARFLLANYIFDEEINFLNIKKYTHTKFYNEMNSNHEIKIIKLHEKFNKIIPKINSDDKIILIYRNIFDVLNSYFHFFNAQHPKRLKNFKEFLGCYHHQFGTWSENFNSWKNSSIANQICFISYENLLNNTENKFIEILNFIGLDINEAKVSNAIKNSSIKNMKKLGDDKKFMKSKSEEYSFVKNKNIRFDTQIKSYLEHNYEEYELMSILYPELINFNFIKNDYKKISKIKFKLFKYREFNL